MRHSGRGRRGADVWRVLRFALLTAGPLGAAGCGEDPAGPLSGEGELYVLRTVAGDSVPAVILLGDYTSWEVLADSILLRADGTGREVFVRRPVYPDAPPGDALREVLDFHYEVEGTGITVTLPCNDALLVANSCIAPPHYAGTVGSASITFDFMLGFLTPAVFERVRPPAGG